MKWPDTQPKLLTDDLTDFVCEHFCVTSWPNQALKDQIMCPAVFNKAMPTPMKTKHKALCALRTRLLNKQHITMDHQGKYVICQGRMRKQPDHQPAIQDPDLQPEQDEQDTHR